MPRQLDDRSPCGAPPNGLGRRGGYDCNQCDSKQTTEHIGRYGCRSIASTRNAMAAAIAPDMASRECAGIVHLMGDELAVARLGEALFARRDDQVSLLPPGLRLNRFRQPLRYR